MSFIGWQESLRNAPPEFSWDNKVAGFLVLMLELSGGEAKYKASIDAFVSYLLNDARYTPKGLIYVNKWGTLRHAANMAHICAQV